jgi:cation diffusion facilitator CzcD-associated flavoprotein CzcO
MHSAQWDDAFDLTGKAVAVIGGGSSAVQIIPSIQARVGKLFPYLRSPVWITAGFGAKYAAPGGVNFECRVLPSDPRRLKSRLLKLNQILKNKR